MEALCQECPENIALNRDEKEAMNDMVRLRERHGEESGIDGEMIIVLRGILEGCHAQS